MLDQLICIQAKQSKIGEINHKKEGRDSEERMRDAKYFIKHVKEIFIELEEAISEEDFLRFHACLEENIKNLGGVRLSKFDKKSEKKYVAGL